MKSSDTKKYLILGFGYSASYLKKYILQKDPNCQIYTTSRKGSPHIEFDLLKEETWKNLPKVDGTFITFAVEPANDFKTFYNSIKEQLGRVVCIGTTSCFKVKEEQQKVTEETPMTDLFGRVEGEGYLLKNKNILVCSSGIYGPQRNPLDWINKGYVGVSDKYVNLVHVDDLAQFLWLAMAKGQEGSVYIASNQNPRTWKEIILEAMSDRIDVSDAEKVSDKISKKIDASQTIKDLGVSLKYPIFRLRDQ